MLRVVPRHRVIITLQYKLQHSLQNHHLGKYIRPRSQSASQGDFLPNVLGTPGVTVTHARPANCEGRGGHSQCLAARPAARLTHKAAVYQVAETVSCLYAALQKHLTCISTRPMRLKQAKHCRWAIPTIVLMITPRAPTVSHSSKPAIRTRWYKGANGPLGSNTKQTKGLQPCHPRLRNHSRPRSCHMGWLKLLNRSRL